MAKNNIGQNRLVVGAHYGLRDWLAQRVTAIVMAVYTLVLLYSFLTGHNFTYEGWSALFAKQWFKLFSLVTFLALYYHAWVGMRDIWMDYVKPVGIRLTLQMLTIFWLVACAFYTVQILWGL
jgi:succinate dehydrogenase / fumarate reductase membrane anchor subunit